jgi:polyisoprenoid-binding protein YceI
MKSNFYHSILAGVAAFSLFSASLAHADVDTGKSSVIATTKQMNVPVDGKFKKFSAQLNFDSAKPTAGSANVSIDTGSYDLGADDYNKQAQGKEWFDSATYPAATFVSSAIAPAGGNQYKISSMSGRANGKTRRWSPTRSSSNFTSSLRSNNWTHRSVTTLSDTWRRT